MANTAPVTSAPTSAPSDLTGRNLIGGQWVGSGEASLRVASRTDGALLPTVFFMATADEVGEAARVASEAFDAYRTLHAEARALFLEAIASAIEELGDALIQRAHQESGLPITRLTGERGRTCGQLRMFARVVREGSWVDARIDHADPTRTPPRPDIRRMLIPMGPVAVFGASNFPLAFSVAGGDTASALAAGCPVVFKAHPAHPGTCEMVAQAISQAAERCSVPAGVFGMVHGDAAVGRALVLCPEIEAVAFTGSGGAGRSLFDLASSRSRPIPVFAEMGSVNPVFVLPGALAERRDAIAKGYSDSLTLGVGQFCTNPGILVGLAGEAFDSLLEGVGRHLSDASPGVMLTDAICAHFDSGRESWSAHPRLEAVYVADPVTGRATPALYRVTDKDFAAHPELAAELFGPAAIAVACESMASLREVVKSLCGQLTATVHFAESDTDEVASLLPLLASIAGRVLANGFPTGVEVCASMQHGGPYPATTDSRFTSVGTAAILRFARPVAYQSIPDAMLPVELQESNPRGIRRMVDDEYVS